VGDPVLRIGHWALVAASVVAYFSTEEEGGMPEPFHVWGGYFVGAIVVLRVLWGLSDPNAPASAISFAGRSLQSGTVCVTFRARFPLVGCFGISGG
jgi:cytochrome b